MIAIGISDVMTVLDKALAIATKLKNAELNAVIIELQSKVMSIQQEIIKLNAENEGLKQQLQEKEQYNMVFEDNAYWNLKPDGSKEGPFCAVCWERDRKTIRFKKVLLGCYSPTRDDTYYADSCPVCNKRR